MTEHLQSATAHADAGRHAPDDGPALFELIDQYERLLLVVTVARTGAPVARGTWPAAPSAR